MNYTDRLNNLSALLGEGGGEDLDEAKDWLPSLLEPGDHRLVSKVGQSIKWEVERAMAFAVALLQDVNAHPEAAAVNKLLNRML